MTKKLYLNHSLAILTMLLFFVLTVRNCARNIGDSDDQAVFDVTKTGRAFTLISLSDTTELPKRPTASVKVSDLYFKKLDTLNIIIINYLGRALTVDQADNLKNIFFRITNDLRKDSVIHN